MQDPAMQMMLVALMAQLMGGNPQLAAILMQQGGFGGQRGSQQGPPNAPAGKQPTNNPFGGMGGIR
jgi:hypothetical protein